MLDFLSRPKRRLAAAALILAAAACARAFRRRSPEVHKRGVILRDCTSPRRLARGALFPPPADDVTLAGISIPGRDETKHFKIIGTTGTGKSTVIREILGAALARGDRAVVADPDGGYHAPGSFIGTAATFS